MAIEIGNDIPESVKVAAATHAKLLALQVWREATPDVAYQYLHHSFADRLDENMFDDLRSDSMEIDQLLHDNDELCMLRFFTKEGKLFLDCMLEVDGGEEDYEIELIAE